MADSHAAQGHPDQSSGSSFSVKLQKVKLHFSSSKINFAKLLTVYRWIFQHPFQNNDKSLQPETSVTSIREDEKFTPN